MYLATPDVTVWDFPLRKLKNFVYKTLLLRSRFTQHRSLNAEPPALFISVLASLIIFLFLVPHCYSATIGDFDIVVPPPPFSLADATSDVDVSSPDCGHQSTELCAQWRSADAAEAGVIWAARSFYLSMVGMIVGAATLAAAAAAAIYAKAATAEARRSADAAYDAVATARKIGEAQTRAYLFLKSAKYRLSKKEIIVVAEVGNTGQSPATNVSYIASLRVLEVGGTRARPRVLTFVASDETTGSLPPVNANSFAVEDIPFFWGVNIPEDKTEVTDKWVFAEGNEIAFDLEVRWQDVFGVSHRFTANLMADVGPSPTNRRTRRSPSGNLVIRAHDPQYDWQV
ncbi:hypothetical protein A6U97_08065 [Agrobacterium tumefaciens]|uniref:hypothetical protein n=1 Tax=Agrobacterium tumefaciens TaxID=358 RepID=UPI00081003DC|nr:hypothetical protein A6U97_08065 [Agrobacterium tumefaciens]